MTQHVHARRSQSVFGWLWRGGLWGTGTGAVLGGMYGALLVILTLTGEGLAQHLNDIGVLPGALVQIVPFAFGIGMILGAPIGLMVGLVNGLLIGLLLRTTNAADSNTAPTRTFLVGITVLLSTILSFLGLTWVRFAFAQTTQVFDPSMNFVVYALLPTIVAGIGAWWVSQHVTRDSAHD